MNSCERGFIEPAVFEAFPEIRALVTTRKVGNMDARQGQSDARNNLVNFCVDNDIPRMQLVGMRQPHGSVVKIVDPKDWAELIDADGIITNARFTFLSVVGADCPPVLMYAPDVKALAAVHLGWRCFAKGIIPKTLRTFCRDMSANVRQIRAFVGPGLCQQHFEFDRDEVPNVIPSESIRLSGEKNGKAYIDFRRAIVKKLLGHGLDSAYIEISPYCTICDQDKFFSYRGNGSVIDGEHMAIIGRIN